MKHLFQRGNNLRRGMSPWNKGKTDIYNEETKKKMGWSKGKKLSPRSKETKKKIGLANSIALKGHKLSKEVREKISKANKGKRKPEGFRIGHRHSLKTRRKISKAHKGEKNWNWKGGITPINKRERFTLEYKLWRITVFERDNFTCQECGAKNGNGKTIILRADHTKPYSLYPDLRFEISNGRTLCDECHKKTKTFGGSRIYRNKNNKNI